jgi:DNA-binding IclR family transcriptional regulator
LYRGATSKIILAHLPPKKVAELFAKDHAALQAAGLADSLDDLNALLKAWRNAGSVTTVAEIDPHNVGCAVALLHGKRVLGSLSVVLPASALSPDQQARNLRELHSAARRIEARMAASSHRKMSSSTTTIP